ncbi:hypothetical protein ABZZ80_31280 [Streptomyces sp. NPDC006356]
MRHAFAYWSEDGQDMAKPVEVLPREPHEQADLPGAPSYGGRFGQGSTQAAGPEAARHRLLRRPAVRPQPPRGAERLRRLGFRQAYDYMPGKADWPAAGMPGEGRTAGRWFCPGTWQTGQPGDKGVGVRVLGVRERSRISHEPPR